MKMKMYQRHKFFANMCSVFVFFLKKKSWSILWCEPQCLVIQPQVLDIVTCSNQCDVTLTEWEAPFPLMSSKCVNWLQFRYCILLLWMNDSIFNSLAPGKFEWNFRYVIFKKISVIGGWGISCEIALIWMSLEFTDDQSTLVQVMPLGNKPLSEPMLTQISVTIWCH